MTTVAIKNSSHPRVQEITAPANLSGEAINDLISATQADYLLFTFAGSAITLGERAIDRFVQIAEDSGAGLVYSDFRAVSDKGEISDHPLMDYQSGSIRDNFDFGSVLLLSRGAILKALAQHGAISGALQWGGIYDLRLKLSLEAGIVRIPEPLYTRATIDNRVSGEKIFDYVDPRNRAYQIEMEQIATAHLKRLNAYLAPNFVSVPDSSEAFPVKASVIIPVRNREKTIADAVRSVLSQKTEFSFNVIVIDNHSTDGTSAELKNIAAADARVLHLIPSRTDYGIGGCWNEGIYSVHCGRYAVQLDSDDIYTNDDTLAKIVAEFEKGKYAMVIGSYTTVDFDLNELPPGLIDHKEWTRDNGRNNALRINGLGAPRAFDVTILRQIGLPNVSYGEDYALALRLSRDYEIGRIYESVYYARRWSGNSDSALPLPTMNRYDTYKDRIRTWEIQARQRKNLA